MKLQFNSFEPDGEAEPTSRLLPDNDDRQEWEQLGKINGVKVSVYYMLDDEDGINGAGDFDGSLIDWESKIDRIEEVE